MINRIIKPNALHHLAFTTGSTKEQIKFFVEVLGCELEGLYWMHNQEDFQAFHSFLRLNESCWISFVEYVGKQIEPIDGITHAISSMHPSAMGTMHHLALNVDTLDDLTMMRNRIRAHGVNVFGPLHHGFCSSIYFAGPEGLNLEISTSTDELNPKKWIDTEVCELAGISLAELKRYISPPPYSSVAGEPVPQPSLEDFSKPRLKLSKEDYLKFMGTPDEELTALFSEVESPLHSLENL